MEQKQWSSHHCALINEFTIRNLKALDVTDTITLAAFHNWRRYMSDNKQNRHRIIFFRNMHSIEHRVVFNYLLAQPQTLDSASRYGANNCFSSVSTISEHLNKEGQIERILVQNWKSGSTTEPYYCFLIRDEYFVLPEDIHPRALAIYLDRKNSNCQGCGITQPNAIRVCHCCAFTECFGCSIKRLRGPGVIRCSNCGEMIGETTSRPCQTPHAFETTFGFPPPRVIIDQDNNSKSDWIPYTSSDFERDQMLAETSAVLSLVIRTPRPSQGGSASTSSDYRYFSFCANVTELFMKHPSPFDPMWKTVAERIDTRISYPLTAIKDDPFGFFNSMEEHWQTHNREKFYPRRTQSLDLWLRMVKSIDRFNKKEEEQHCNDRTQMVIRIGLLTYVNATTDVF